MSRKPRPTWIDPSALYTRSDIAEKVGIADDVLSFWIKRKLLVPEGKATGKGVHLRFHYSQIGVAVVLKAIRDHFGANVGALKSLADTLQDAIRLFRRTTAPVEAWMAATRLADRLDRFRKGEEVEVVLFLPEAGAFPGDNSRSERRVATSEAEIVADSLQISDGRPSDIIHLAEMLGPDRSSDFEVALALLATPINPRYAGNNYWLLANKDGDWIIHNDSDDGLRDRSKIGPAMFLPVFHMVRKAWKIPGNLRQLDQCLRLRAALKDARVDAEVSPGEPYPQVRVARDEDKAKAQDILNNFYKPDWMKERDGDDFSAYPDPETYEDIYWTPEDTVSEIQRLKDELIKASLEEEKAKEANR